MKYALIRRNRRVWPIRIQCRRLGVSVAGYHDHFVRRLQIPRRRHLSAEALVVHIRAAYAANRPLTLVCETIAVRKSMFIRQLPKNSLFQAIREMRAR